jgi:signal transduction histidine kinase
MPAELPEEHRLRRLLEVGRGLVSELDLEALLKQLLEVARELTGARYAALRIIDATRGDELERFIASGIDDETYRAIGDPPSGRGVLGELMSTAEPLRLTDVREHPLSTGFPPGHPPMTSMLAAPILIRGGACGSVYVTNKAGGPFTDDDAEALSVLAEWASIAIVNARLYAGLEQQRSELERAVQGLEATTTIARAIGDETDLSRVLALIATSARALVEARTVLILLEEDDVLRLAATAGEARASAAELRVPIKESLPGAVWKEGQPIRLTDLQSMSRLGLTDFVGVATTALLVPLTFRGRSSGLLVAFDRLAEDSEFDAEDERLLTAFAASAATAVATAQTVETQRLRDSIQAADEERGRWARELHDETLQGLGALHVLLTGRRRLAGGAEAVQDQAIAQLEDEIGKLQGLITDLRPAALDDIGLGPAVTALMKRAQVAQAAKIELELELGLDYEAGRAMTRLLPDIESTVFRLVQEALTNVGKHSEAKHVEISIVEQDGSITATVSDDGIGFDPESTSRGFGLVGMRERAGLIGGGIELRSAPGEGTKVIATVPAHHLAPGA